MLLKNISMIMFITENLHKRLELWESKIHTMRGSSLPILGFQSIPIVNLIVRVVKERQLFEEITTMGLKQVFSFKERDVLRRNFLGGVVIQVISSIALGIIFPQPGTAFLLYSLGSLAAHYTIEWIYEIPQKLELRLVNASSFYT